MAAISTTAVSKAVVVCLLALLSGASCLASPERRRRIIRVVSTNKNGGHSTTFSFEPTTSTPSNAPTASNQLQQQIRQLLNVRNLVQTTIKPGLRSTFLPVGYPSRTPPGYLRYCVWSWIQDLSTQLRGVLATQRILEGVGVGREGATALSALLNFLVRDGCGMAASLVFTAGAASRFQTDVKRWRLLADVMVDIGITLEVAAPQVPAAFFLPMISVGSMCKAICGVAAGACGGAINLYWAGPNGADISDISAKFGAQHTVTGSLGLIFAALFARSMASVDNVHIWIMYLALTALHIFANMRCMRLIAFDSFNTVRFNMVVSDFLDKWRSDGSIEATTTTIEPPTVISKKEPLFFLVPRLRLGKTRSVSPGRSLRFGVSFNEFAERSGKSQDELEAMLNSKDPYWIAVEDDKSQTRRSSRCCVTVALRSTASPLDIAKAYFHALVLLERKDTATDDAINMDAACWDSFCQHCRTAGWDLNRTELQTRGYEVQVEGLDKSQEGGLFL